MAAKKKRAKNGKQGGKPKPGKGGKGGSAAKAKAAGAKGRDATPAGAKAKPAGKEKPKVDVEPLKKKAKEAKAALDKAAKDAEALREKARATEAAARKAYAQAFAPYRDACRRAGVKCALACIKAPPVAPRVRFLVERTKGGIKVAIKGRPDTEKVITDRVLKESVGKAAKAYCEKHLGSIASQGAKHAGLGNRFRAVLRAT
jgi:hypothetical protein